MTDLALDSLEVLLRSTVTATSYGGGFEVTLPVLFPDGENATVIVMRAATGFLVHDGSNGAMSMESAGGRLTAAVADRLARLVGRYGCDFTKGRVERTCLTDELPLACVAVANASRVVADHALGLRPHLDDRFGERVQALAREVVGRRLRENQQIKGRTGRAYRVAHVVLDEREAHPVAFVVPITVRASVATNFAELYDLKQSHADVANEAIYDEDSDLRPEDRYLLADVSTLSPLRLMRPRLLALIGHAVGVQ